ncbi:fungal zn(2)-Cys(6) binuclear cluster domain-containing protein [Sarocladium implicatum]|nr:fungal zn(2)-Cys(6) binuclear cluster domain-containing protein [Sarocladium implicatum]
MTLSRASKPAKRDRQRITRTACEPCREKRAKCDGESPCGRCQTRGLDCHFTERTWASKRSLQEEAAALRQQVERRERVLDIICAPDGSGDDILGNLRAGRATYDDVYDQLQDAGDTSRMNIDTTTASNTQQQQHNGSGSCDCVTCWSPSTTNSNMLSSVSGQSPFSFLDSALTDESVSQGTNMSDQPAQHPDNLQQQMNPIQSIPWAGAAPNTNSFDNMLDATSSMPPIDPVMGGDCPSVIDPLLWPPVTGSDPLGQPMLNSWTGLMGGPEDLSRPKPSFPSLG